MISWSPIFSSIVDSSLWTEPLHVRILFLTMVAIKDADHVVRADEFALSRRASLTQDEVTNALSILSSPDRKRSNPQLHDGRRIQKVTDGWLILNGQKYRDMMSKLKRRQYQADWQRKYRAAKKSNPLPGEEVYVNAEKNGASPATLESILDAHL